VGREIGDTTNCIALNLDIRRHHLPDQGGEPAETNDGEFIFGYGVLAEGNRSEQRTCTVDGQISQCSTCRPLNLNVRAL
jgi:hypothetical protein